MALTYKIRKYYRPRPKHILGPLFCHSLGLTDNMIQAFRSQGDGNSDRPAIKVRLTSVGPMLTSWSHES